MIAVESDVETEVLGQAVVVAISQKFCVITCGLSHLDH